MKIFNIKSVFAGCSIAVAAFLYLKIGGIIGATLFSGGLIAVVSMQLPLFTGQAQYIRFDDALSYARLFVMLICNLIGVIFIAFFLGNAETTFAAANIILSRIHEGWWKCCLMAVLCGYIMTMSVSNARKGKWLPLLFGIPTFILCGFPHCIADFYYYCTLPSNFITNENYLTLILIYLSTVVGNFVGCNLYRL